MVNHYHLLLEIKEPEEISSFMAGLNRAYAHYYHKTYQTCGFLWQGRFKLRPIQKERYLIACGRYIERNPVKAEVVTYAQDYPYSSSSYYCFGNPDGITCVDPAYIQFSEEIIQRREKYKEFLLAFDNEEEILFNNLENPLGDAEFTKRLIRRQGRWMPRRQGRIS